jgi:7,8-dihydropterin-6-yl-methyl-4-(beta-D-ribofuranosyl)aminobenzene 5'-phosphate synthase
MKTLKILSVFLCVVFYSLQLAGQEFKYLDNTAGLNEITAVNGIESPVTIKVVYDNYVKVEGLKSDWGFSIVIEGLEKGILFDTGTNPDIFEFNFSKMGLDAKMIDLIVLSHEHMDHIGGLPAVVKLKTDIPVLFPYTFSDSFKSRMVDLRLQPLLVREPAKICDNIYTSGVFQGQIPEQALVLNTKKGLVVMTGCSHPGIIEMLKVIKKEFNKNICFVFGGFHLMNKSVEEMNEIISDLKSIGVVKCGATHCTGEKQIQMIKDSFGDNFVGLGVGNTIVIN